MNRTYFRFHLSRCLTARSRGSCRRNYFMRDLRGVQTDVCSQTLSLACRTCQLGDDVARYWASLLSIGPQPMSIGSLRIEFQLSGVGVLGHWVVTGDTRRKIAVTLGANRRQTQMKVFHVPCLEDNYSYLIVDESSKEAAVVDPAEPEKVLEAAKQHGVLLKLVLTTHHHWDHAGGNDKIKQLVPGIKVYGGSIDNVKGCTDKVENGDKLHLGAHVNILCLHTPSHTKGHISYYVTSKEEEDPAVFTGDTLFIAGCGKFFEGTAEQMYQSLCVTLGSLPKPTRVYCGHEYTVKNLQFALTVEPENVKIQQKLTWAQHQRQAGLPTIPSTIVEELETNPFMRVDMPELQTRVGCQSPVEALREIRQRKDNWRG